MTFSQAVQATIDYWKTLDDDNVSRAYFVRAARKVMVDEPESVYMPVADAAYDYAWRRERGQDV